MRVYGWLTMGTLGVLLTGGGLVHTRGDRRTKVKGVDANRVGSGPMHEHDLHNDSKRLIEAGEVVLLVLEE